jgi:hypothetical protein
MVEEAKHSDP